MYISFLMNKTNISDNESINKRGKNVYRKMMDIKPYNLRIKRIFHNE